MLHPDSLLKLSSFISGVLPIVALNPFSTPLVAEEEYRSNARFDLFGKPLFKIIFVIISVRKSLMYKKNIEKMKKGFESFIKSSTNLNDYLESLKIIHFISYLFFIHA